MMTEKTRVGRNALCLMALYALMVVLVPNHAVADWPQPRGNSGRTANQAPGGTQQATPIAPYGFYEFLGLGTFTTELLIDSERLYTVAPSAIQVFSIYKDHEEANPFVVDEPIWHYIPIEFFEETNELVTLQGKPALIDDMLVSAQQTMNAETNERTLSIVGRDLETGDVVWDFPIANGQSATVFPYGGDLFVYYDIQDENFNTSRYVARLAPRANAFTAQHEVDFLFSVESGMIVGMGNSVILNVREELHAINFNSMEPSWTYSPSSADHGESASNNIRDMISHGSSIYVVSNPAHVYKLNSLGELDWAVDVFRPDDCTGGHRFLTSRGPMLLLSGLCSEYVVGMDTNTGDELWRTEDLSQFGTNPAISGNTAFVSSLVIAEGEFFASPAVVSIDVTNGEILDTSRLESGAAGISGFAVSQERLYGYTDGGLGSGGRIVAYEREPAALSVSIDFPDLEIHPCGIYQERTYDLTITVENSGPGLAPNASIRVQTSGNPTIEFEEGSDYEIGWSDGARRLQLGDVEPDTTMEIPITVTFGAAWFTGQIALEAESNVRNTAGDEASDKIDFTTLSPYPEDLELAISAIEVTQGIQDLDNSIPLAARKSTLVRAHIDASHVVEGVRAHLYINGVAYQNPYRPETGFTSQEFRFEDKLVLPLEDCLTVGPELNDRGVLRHSFNFVLPRDVLRGYPHGPLEFRVVLDPDETLEVSDRSAMTLSESLEFEWVGTICVYSMGIKTRNQDGDIVVPSPRIPDEMRNRAEALLPTPNLSVFPRNHVIDTALGAPYEFDIRGTTNNVRVLTKLIGIWATSAAHSSCTTAHWLGLIAEDVYTTDPDLDNARYNGEANLPGRALVVRLRDLEGTGIDRPRAGTTLAHELGHNFFRWHVDCGNPDGALSNYPYNPCVLGTLSPTGFFGTDLIDPSNPEIIVPRPADSEEGTLSDLMSYASDRWTSDYTWLGIMGNVTFSKESMETAEVNKAFFGSANPLETAWLDAWKSESDGEILVTAVVGEDKSEEINILALPHGYIPQENREKIARAMKRGYEMDSPYHFELLDEDGNILLTLPAEVQLTMDGPTSHEFLNGIVPDLEGLASIRLIHDEEGTVMTRTRPDAAPTVNLTQPTGTANIDGEIIVDWDASHPEEIDLSAVVQYSVDDGETWETLGMELGAPPHTFETDFLPGSGQARIRVIISDGFNTAQATSDSFTVASGTPTVEIHRPIDGNVYMAMSPIFAHAWAFDPEDGPLGDNELTWLVEETGDEGIGTDFIFAISDPGLYTVTVTAEDSDGNITTDSVTIEIEPPAPTRRDIMEIILGIMPSLGDLRYDLNEDGVIDAADLHEDEE
ncbi:MAG: PQQ-binding-like beta-propeller repeat protein [Candidatus Sumerlaeia bacterium]|nr:PQQ-binding-like beta-propeller repeat protein [Candidatus Sumerlaeia bacterium]